MNATNETNEEVATTATPEETEKKSKKKKATEVEPASASASESTETETPKEVIAFEKKKASEFILIDPKKLRFPSFDSRASDRILDEPFKADIATNGVMQPPLVAPVKNPVTGEIEYMIVDGRGRTRAAIEVGLKQIKCTVEVMDFQTALIASVNLNEKRQGLSAWDRAHAYNALKVECHMTQTEIADSVGKSNAYVTHHLQILDLDERVKTMVKRGKFDLTKIRELARIKDGDDQFMIATKAIENPDKPWTAEAIHEATERLKAKEIERAEREAEKEKEKAKAAKKAKKAEGAVETAGADKEEEEEPTKEEPKAVFNYAEMTPVPKKTMHALLEAANLRLQKLRGKVDSTATDKYKDKPEVKELCRIAEEKGVLKGLKQASGLAKIPESLTGDSE